MKTSTFFTVAALYSAVVGLSFLCFPNQYSATFGVHHLDDIHRVLGRYVADTNLGLAITWYLSRNVIAPSALRALLTGCIVVYTVGIIISVVSMASGAVPVGVWGVLDMLIRCGMLGGAVYCFFHIRPVTQYSQLPASLRPRG